MTMPTTPPPDDVLAPALADGPIGLCVLDQEARIVYVNPAFCVLHDRDPGALLGQPGLILAPADPGSRPGVTYGDLLCGRIEAAGAFDLGRDVVGTTTIYAAARHIVDAQGRRRTVISASPMAPSRDHSCPCGPREAHGRTGTCADDAVTCCLLDAIENMAEGFIVSDAKDRVVFANTRFHKLFPEIDDLVAPGVPFARLARAAAERGRINLGGSIGESLIAERLDRLQRLPNQFDLFNGQGRRIQVREMPTAEGGCVALYDDVTDRYLREQKLRERERQLAASQRIAHLGSWRRDLRDDSLSWSEEMYRLFGVAPERFDLRLESFLGCIHIEDRAMVEAIMASTISTHGGARFEFRIIRPSGEERALWAELTCEIAPDGATIGLFGICQDITARRIEERLLVQAKIAAEEANQSKSRFLANVSHELRTPLNAIIGFSEIMASELMGPLGNSRYVDYAGGIWSSGCHLLELINDVLDLARIEAGRYDLIEEAIEIDQAFGEVTQITRSLAESKDVHLEAQAAGPLRLRADRRALRQMLVNLVSNGIKFTPTRGTVTLRAALARDGLHLDVVDTGIGIPPERIGELGRPFVQIDPGYDRRHDGTGIGLYLTRSLIELHQGRLDIASKPGQGTTVSLIFPAERLLPESP
ncbi:MAG: PAS domain S-box protein [Azospirillum sp.]|nr:PAS domain S-box protein [Azospirillum sp.]